MGRKTNGRNFTPEKRMSMLKLKSVVINAPIPEDLIGLRALKDETFLEEGLNKIRSGK